jgi:hypothetical protein
MTNWIFALLAYASLLVFFGIVIWFVPHPDLVIVVLIGLALAGYDIATQLRRLRV